ncbi:hypothetical protein D4Q80_00760, partial [bacterium]
MEDVSACDILADMLPYLRVFDKRYEDNIKIVEEALRGKAVVKRIDLRTLEINFRRVGSLWRAGSLYNFLSAIEEVTDPCDLGNINEYTALKVEGKRLILRVGIENFAESRSLRKKGDLCVSGRSSLPRPGRHNVAVETRTRPEWENFPPRQLKCRFIRIDKTWDLQWSDKTGDLEGVSAEELAAIKRTLLEKLLPKLIHAPPLEEQLERSIEVTLRIAAETFPIEGKRIIAETICNPKNPALSLIKLYPIFWDYLTGKVIDPDLDKTLTNALLDEFIHVLDPEDTNHATFFSILNDYPDHLEAEARLLWNEAQNPRYGLSPMDNWLQVMVWALNFSQLGFRRVYRPQAKTGISESLVISCPRPIEIIMGAVAGNFTLLSPPEVLGLIIWNPSLGHNPSGIEMSGECYGAVTFEPVPKPENFCGLPQGQERNLPYDPTYDGTKRKFDIPVMVSEGQIKIFMAPKSDYGANGQEADGKEGLNIPELRLTVDNDEVWFRILGEEQTAIFKSGIMGAQDLLINAIDQETGKSRLETGIAAVAAVPAIKSPHLALIEQAKAASEITAARREADRSIFEFDFAKALEGNCGLDVAEKKLGLGVADAIKLLKAAGLEKEKIEDGKFPLPIYLAMLNARYGETKKIYGPRDIAHLATDGFTIAIDNGGSKIYLGFSLEDRIWHVQSRINRNPSRHPVEFEYAQLADVKEADYLLGDSARANGQSGWEGMISESLIKSEEILIALALASWPKLYLWAKKLAAANMGIGKIAVGGDIFLGDGAYVREGFSFSFADTILEDAKNVTARVHLEEGGYKFKILCEGSDECVLTSGKLNDAVTIEDLARARSFLGAGSVRFDDDLLNQKIATIIEQNEGKGLIKFSPGDVVVSLASFGYPVELAYPEIELLIYILKGESIDYCDAWVTKRQIEKFIASLVYYATEKEGGDWRKQLLEAVWQNYQDRCSTAVSLARVSAVSGRYDDDDDEGLAGYTLRDYDLLAELVHKFEPLVAREIGKSKQRRSAAATAQKPASVRAGSHPAEDTSRFKAEPAGKEKVQGTLDLEAQRFGLEIPDTDAKQKLDNNVAKALEVLEKIGLKPGKDKGAIPVEFSPETPNKRLAEVAGEGAERRIIFSWAMLTRAPPDLLVQLTLAEEILHYYYPNQAWWVHALIDNYLLSEENYPSFLAAVKEAQSKGIRAEENWLPGLEAIHKSEEEVRKAVELSGKHPKDYVSAVDISRSAAAATEKGQKIFSAISLAGIFLQIDVREALKKKQVKFVLAPKGWLLGAAIWQDKESPAKEYYIILPESFSVSGVRHEIMAVLLSITHGENSALGNCTNLARMQCDGKYRSLYSKIVPAIAKISLEQSLPVLDWQAGTGQGRPVANMEIPIALVFTAVAIVSLMGYPPILVGYIVLFIGTIVALIVFLKGILGNLINTFVKCLFPILGYFGNVTPALEKRIKDKISKGQYQKHKGFTWLVDKTGKFKVEWYVLRQEPAEEALPEIIWPQKEGMTLKIYLSPAVFEYDIFQKITDNQLFRILTAVAFHEATEVKLLGKSLSAEEAHQAANRLTREKYPEEAEELERAFEREFRASLPLAFSLAERIAADSNISRTSKGIRGNTVIRIALSDLRQAKPELSRDVDVYCLTPPGNKQGQDRQIWACEAGYMVFGRLLSDKVKFGTRDLCACAGICLRAKKAGEKEPYFALAHVIPSPSGVKVGCCADIVNFLKKKGFKAANIEIAVFLDEYELERYSFAEDWKLLQKKGVRVTVISIDKSTNNRSAIVLEKQGAACVTVNVNKERKEELDVYYKWGEGLRHYGMERIIAQGCPQDDNRGGRWPSDSDDLLQPSNIRSGGYQRATEVRYDTDYAEQYKDLIAQLISEASKLLNLLKISDSQSDGSYAAIARQYPALRRYWTELSSRPDNQSIEYKVARNLNSDAARFGRNIIFNRQFLAKVIEWYLVADDLAKLIAVAAIAKVLFHEFGHRPYAKGKNKDIFTAFLAEEAELIIRDSKFDRFIDELLCQYTQLDYVHLIFRNIFGDYQEFLQNIERDFPREAALMISRRLESRLNTKAVTKLLKQGYQPYPHNPAEEAGIDINDPDLERLSRQLSAVTGLSKGAVRGIIAWRRQHGLFTNFEQVGQIRGVGRLLRSVLKPITQPEDRSGISFKELLKLAQETKGYAWLPKANFIFRAFRQLRINLERLEVLLRDLDTALVAADGIKGAALLTHNTPIIERYKRLYNERIFMRQTAGVDERGCRGENAALELLRLTYRLIQENSELKFTINRMDEPFTFATTLFAAARLNLWDCQHTLKRNGKEMVNRLLLDPQVQHILTQMHRLAVFSALIYNYINMLVMEGEIFCVSNCAELEKLLPYIEKAARLAILKPGADKDIIGAFDMRIEYSQNNAYLSCDTEVILALFVILFLNSFYSLSSKYKENAAQGRINISISRKGDKVEIEFTDNGEGISAGNLSRIFDVGFTTHPEVLPSGSIIAGTGLSTLKFYVEFLGGEMEVKSQDKEGTSIRVRLPVSAAETKRSEETLSQENKIKIIQPIREAEIEKRLREYIRDFNSILIEAGGLFRQYASSEDLRYKEEFFRKIREAENIARPAHDFIMQNMEVVSSLAEGEMRNGVHAILAAVGEELGDLEIEEFGRRADYLLRVFAPKLSPSERQKIWEETKPVIRPMNLRNLAELSILVVEGEVMKQKPVELSRAKTEELAKTDRFLPIIETFDLFLRTVSNERKPAFASQQLDLVKQRVFFAQILIMPGLEREFSNMFFIHEFSHYFLMSGVLPVSGDEVFPGTLEILSLALSGRIDLLRDPRLKGFREITYCYGYPAYQIGRVMADELLDEAARQQKIERAIIELERQSISDRCLEEVFIKGAILAGQAHRAAEEIAAALGQPEAIADIAHEIIYWQLIEHRDFLAAKAKVMEKRGGSDAGAHLGTPETYGDAQEYSACGFGICTEMGDMDAAATEKTQQLIAQARQKERIRQYQDLLSHIKAIIEQHPQIVALLKHEHVYIMLPESGINQRAPPWMWAESPTRFLVAVTQGPVIYLPLALIIFLIENNNQELLLEIINHEFKHLSGIDKQALKEEGAQLAQRVLELWIIKAASAMLLRMQQGKALDSGMIAALAEFKEITASAADWKGAELRGDPEIERILRKHDRLLERAEKIASGEIHVERIHMRAKFTPEDIARFTLQEALAGYIQAAEEIQRLRQRFGKETPAIKSLSTATANRIKRVITLLAQLVIAHKDIIRGRKGAPADKLREAEQAERQGNYAKAIEIYLGILRMRLSLPINPADKIRENVAR